MGKVTTPRSNDKPTKKKQKRAERGTIHDKYEGRVRTAYEQIINNLERYRLENNISKISMAQKSGLDSNQIRHYLNFRNEPSFGKLLQVVDAMDTDLLTILTYHQPEIDDRTKHKIDDTHRIVSLLLRLSQKDGI